MELRWELEESDNSESKVIVPAKSSNKELVSLKINDKEIEIKDRILFETYDIKINIEAKTRDDKASVKIDNKDELDIGENKIIIKVTAEDESNKEYELIVNRKKILSNNKNIKIAVFDKEIIFKNFESEEINVQNKYDSLDISFELEDENAKVEILNNNLKEGKNRVIIKVIAEDKSTHEYVINTYRYGKFEENMYGIFALLVLGGIGFGIYAGVKKLRRDKSN